jgi:hypothetical protein
MYTVWSNYGATGEGFTYMVLYTRGYGEDNNSMENALKEFKRIFGPFYGAGAEVKEGLCFDFPGNEFLVSAKAREMMTENLTQCNQSYHASYHMNFS